MTLSKDGGLDFAWPRLSVLLRWLAYHDLRSFIWRVPEEQAIGMYLTPEDREEVWYTLQGGGVRHISTVVGMPVAGAISWLVEQELVIGMAHPVTEHFLGGEHLWWLLLKHAQLKQVGMDLEQPSERVV